MSSELLDLFNANNGVVSCVGAGGKKTTMFQLAKAHAGRVGITATAHIEYFPKTLDSTNYIGDEAEILASIRADRTSRLIAFAKPSARFGRRAGVSAELIKRVQDECDFELILIKADGARSRFVKAPAEHEPPVPEFSNTVIPVVSARVIGQPLREKIAHRVEHLSNITGLNENAKIKPEHIAKLFASNNGALKNSGDAKIVPLINMVDYIEQEALAKEAAQLALSMTDRFNKVVLAAMKEENPIVDVITR